VGNLTSITLKGHKSPETLVLIVLLSLEQPRDQMESTGRQNGVMIAIPEEQVASVHCRLAIYRVLVLHHKTLRSELLRFNSLHLQNEDALIRSVRLDRRGKV
jgi:hypothetical protein